MAIEQRENLKNVHMQDLGLSTVHHQYVCLQLLFPESVTHFPLDNLLNKEKAVVL